MDIRGVKNLAELARRIAETQHAGNYYAMAKRLQVSTGLVYQWKDGLVKRPSPDSLMKLSDAYGLDYSALVLLTTPRPKPARRAVAPLLLVLATGLGAYGFVSPASDNTPVWRILSRRRRARFLGGTPWTVAPMAA